MRKNNRRQMLGTFGLASAASIASMMGSFPLSSSAADNTMPGMNAWKWQPIDPAAAAQRAYDIYPDGSCMYAVFGSVMTLLAEKYGVPFSTFPTAMMMYGAEGCFYGSLCGAANGAAALIGLFNPGLDLKSRREAMIQEIFAWYEANQFPSWKPMNPAFDGELPTNASGSVLCHISMGLWCRTAKKSVGSPERKERCRRLSAETAQKITELLNRAVDPECKFAGLPSATTSCTLCHNPKGQSPTSTTSMRCDACHTMLKDHPSE